MLEKNLRTDACTFRQNELIVHQQSLYADSLFNAMHVRSIRIDLFMVFDLDFDRFLNRLAVSVHCTCILTVWRLIYRPFQLNRK